jgi:hypothetical protein
MKDVERPNDIDSLKKLIIQLFEEIDRLKAVVWVWIATSFMAVTALVFAKKKAPVNEIISYDCLLPEGVDAEQAAAWLDLYHPCTEAGIGPRDTLAEGRTGGSW